MAADRKYQKIIKYLAEVVCTQPLHIGSASGSKEEVLVHPADGMPFVQASSISGVLRQYYDAKQHDEKTAKKLFGIGRTETGANALDGASLVRFSDGIFCKDNLVLELRPRVKINPETGTCDSSTITGTDRQAGHKYNMESIGAGAEFTFSMYLYDEDLQADLEEILAAVHQGAVQLGGQKSNGCGFLKLKSLKRAVFDMTREDDRRKWADEEELPDSAYEDILFKLKTPENRAVAYEITVNGRTEGELLVKSIAVRNYGKDAPDSMNIQNATGEYIVPGSSLKGAVRSQMEKIADYLGNNHIIEETFGRTGKSQDEGKAGNIVFCDTIIGNKEENDKAKIKSRIHIDKFTGGVFHGGLFNEKNVSGELTLRVIINNKNNPKASCGLLLLALRDLAIGTMSVGSGYSVGKGIIDVDSITVCDRLEGGKAAILVKSGKITGKKDIVSECVKAVQTKEEAV